MHAVSKTKYEYLKRLATQENLITALAIDQRGSLKKMIAANSSVDPGDGGIIRFKEEISRCLTPYASAILLDPEYGLPAAQVRAENAGLLIAYEETGYDATTAGRLPDLLPIWSAKRIREQGADAVKLLIYYDVDEAQAINEQKQAFVERVGSECMAEEIPFFLEILSYDATSDDVKSQAFAKVKPRKVIEAMRVFSKERYGVDVLKVEVPVNMNYVEGFARGGEAVHSRQEALAYFAEQAQATQLPFIFLSAGVSAELFQETLRFAKEGKSTFNGVLCGRATWMGAVPIFAQQGEAAARAWLQTVGRNNIEELNKVVQDTAIPWTDKIRQV